MFINWQHRELILKIVYYGPALSGKTTNLQQIHARADPRRRGELVALKLHEDRTLYFDFLQLELGKISGLSPKIHLYSVPGQNHFEASRKLVVRGADGIVFVADSAACRTNANIEAWESMQAQLQALNLPANPIPVVIQLNKRDVPNAMPVPLLKSIFKVSHQATFESVATTGQGVFDTLKAIINSVVTQVQQEVA
ncbi:MAG: Mutual gliding-motility protein MglA [Anaerolineae bacterium]|nr:Mutual gliding-motility protein MglA [Anaerolineae bacterium]